MAAPTAPGQGDAPGRGSQEHPPGVAVHDWEALEKTPEFRELITRKKAFVLPATIFFLAYYMAFILLAGYAEDFMASSVYEGLTVGYVLALTQFVMVFVLGMLYLRKSDAEYDPLRARVVELAERGGSADPGARVERDEAPR